MKRAILTLALTCAVSTPLPTLAAEFYVYPTNGDTSNDGSALSPWRTIQEVLDAGLIESQEWAQLPYEPGATLVPKNPGAPVQGGDTIYLRSGYHGELFIESFYNTSVITIAAESGHRPELTKVHVRSSARWTIRGLQISPEFAPTYEPDTLIRLESHNWRGPIHDIAVEHCNARSVEDSSGWSADDWNALSCNGIQVDGENMTVRDNVFKNVNFGISVSAANSLIEGNLVENFAGDGLRGLGDNTTFQYNTIKNCYAVNQNHDDGFQSWSLGEDGQVGTGEVTGIVLRGNTIINYEDPNQPHRGTLQGIGCFDGTFVDWVVENNVVITDHWHGITLSGARDCRIVNNTVIDLNDQDPGPPWVRIGAHNNGTRSTGCIVRNNLTTALNVDDDQDVTQDHNLIIEDAESLFVDVLANDLHLRRGCAAVDTGSSELAPAADIENIPRPQGDAVDIGAYEYHDGSVTPAVNRDGGPEADGGTQPDAAADAAAGASGSGWPQPDAAADAAAGASGSGGGGSGSGAAGTGGSATGSGTGASGGTIGDGVDAADSGSDAGTADARDTAGGCSCSMVGGSPTNGWLALLMTLVVAFRVCRRQLRAAIIT